MILQKNIIINHKISVAQNIGRWNNTVGCPSEIVILKSDMIRYEITAFRFYNNDIRCSEMSDVKPQHRQEIEDAFRLFDPESTGFINTKDLKVGDISGADNGFVLNETKENVRKDDYWLFGMFLFV